MLTKVRLVKAMVFPVVMYGCESWTVKKAECQRIDAFELWCWRRLLTFTFSVVSEGSTSRVMVFPIRVFTKISILAAVPPQMADPKKLDRFLSVFFNP